MSVGHVTHPGCLNFIVESCKRSFSGRRTSDAKVVSATAKEHSLLTCYRFVTMVKAGMKQAHVTTHISVSVRSIKIWLSRDHTGESFRSRAGRGRMTALSRVAKIVLANAALKKQKCVKKLARKLTAKGSPTSKTSVHQYLTKCLHSKEMKLRRQPSLSDVLNRMAEFCKGVQQLDNPAMVGRLLFSDQLPFELLQV